MSKWQPIETAPKDGTAILGYADGVIATVEWFEQGGWWVLCESSDASDGEWMPTHWLPLPEPPSEEKP